ncbi:MAG: carboxypeptidase regulatory-like domain-containing protein [Polyangiaceae bacterium]|nr:carboxypeptidase regulatory-like domain-containing protein [Polyangiaceae bacterium]
MKTSIPWWVMMAAALASSSACTKDLAELGMGPVVPESPAADHEEPAAPTPPAAQVCSCPHSHEPALAQPLAPGEPDSRTASDGGEAPPSPAVVAPVATGVGSIRGVVTSPPRSTRAVVYVEGAPADPSRGMRASVNQHRMQFIPHVTTVSVGGKVVFHNGDPFPHNVFSPDQGGFDLGTWGKGGARVYTFKRPGIYSLLCNLHPAMLAYVVAVPSSHFAVTDRSGAFEIQGVPQGSYQVTATGPRLGQATKTVAVAGGEVSVDFVLEKSK